ncbi:hypothetical protein COL154_013230, partial [Colletotrichum chrysophilum]
EKQQSRIRKNISQKGRNPSKQIRQASLGPPTKTRRSKSSPTSPTSAPPAPEPNTAPQTTNRKRSRDDQDDLKDSGNSKKPRTSTYHYKLVPGEADKTANNEVGPIEHWAREGRWPRGYFDQQPDMEHLLARKKSLSSLGRKRSGSGSATSVTPSDQRPREEKTAPYRDPRYRTLLETKGSFMDESPSGIADESKTTNATLLASQQTIPKDSLFRDDLFKATCRKVADKNEARVIRDITPLIVPSAENLATYGASELDCLIESVNEGWNNSIPLTSTRPQPDYSVGFRREAFTDDQLEKLSPFIGNFIAGDQSFFMATYLMHFPFLTCEVKCGAAALDIADRQNTHSGTLAVRATVELFRLVKREKEIDRQILAFSISHDHRLVRIYGHYPVIDGKNTKYYRYPIRTFDFTELDGKEKWTAYQFTRNVYTVWMPTHFKRICSVIDQLPSDLDFDVPELPETGLSQEFGNHHLSQSDVDSSPASAEGDHQSGTPNERQTTPDTSVTGSALAKKARRSQGRRR